MQIIPMQDLKNTVEIEKRCAEENGPVFVTQNGYGRLVVMDIEYYERTMQAMEEARMINKGMKNMEALMWTTLFPFRILATDTMSRSSPART